ncbi:MAG: hypothetical protein ACLFO2_04285 [Candidatus Woesearchaeota archaeon]
MKRDTEILLNHLDRLNERIIHRSVILELVRNVLRDEPRPYLERLRRSGRLVYIIKGYYYRLSIEEYYNNYTSYSSLEMVAAVLNKLKMQWYVGLQSALQHHKLVWQQPRAITIISDSLSGEKVVRKTRFLFRKVRRDLIFSYQKHYSKKNIRYNVSSVEKTIADMAYFAVPVPKEVLEAAKPRELKKCLETYPKITKQRLFS